MAITTRTATFISTFLYIAVFATALYLTVTRGGIIAWTSLILALGLGLKAWFRPKTVDVALACTLGIASLAAWIGTQQYVIATWESGEVVELTMQTSQGSHTARLWVLDIGSNPIVYYDAPPAAADALLAGQPVVFTRAGESSSRIPLATPVEALPEEESSRVLETMNTKYGDRNDAAFIYFALLGRARDRVALVVELTQP